MSTEKAVSEQDPSEGCRATVERELQRLPAPGESGDAIRKADTPNDGLVVVRRAPDGR